MNNKWIKSCIFALLVMVSSLFLTCSKSKTLPTEPDDNGGGIQGELTSEQRDILFNAVDSAYDAMQSDPPEILATNLAAFLNTRPEIDSAGVIDSISVWAWFTDDRILVIPNNRPPTGAGESVGEWPESPIENEIPRDFVLPERRFIDWVPTTISDRISSSSGPDDRELPHSIQAHVIGTLGAPCFKQSAPMIKKLLESNGYVTIPSSGSVQSLLNIDGDGVFYIDAHGGPGVDRNNNSFLAIWTTSLYSPANDSIFASLLRKHELVYAKAYDRNPTTGACEDQIRYAFTGKFVAQYMYFAPASMVFINACLSDSVSSLRQGFFTAGASVFCGWSREVNEDPSNKAAEFLFDRLLGANASNLSPRESPPQRPFEVDRVWQDMKNRGYDSDPSLQSKLRVKHLQNHFGLLAPSIRHIDIYEHTDSLFILGSFGSDPGSKGRVIVGGSELPILDWQPDLIIASIPNTGAGSAGPVTVEVDGLVGPSYSVKRKSNVVNLTEWRGPITYTYQDAGTLTATITVDAHWRADIHSYRDTPHTSPIYYPIVFMAADDSYGTVTADGEYSYTEPGPDPTTNTWTWSGSDFVKPPWNSYPNWWVLSGKVLVDTHKFELMAQLVATVGLSETLVNSSEGFVSTDPFHIGTPVELYDSPPWIHIDMSNTWEILAGHRNTLTCCSHNPNADYVTHTLSWPTILPYFPPDTTQAQ